MKSALLLTFTLAAIVFVGIYNNQLLLIENSPNKIEENQVYDDLVGNRQPQGILEKLQDIVVNETAEINEQELIQTEKQFLSTETKLETQDPWGEDLYNTMRNYLNSNGVCASKGGIKCLDLGSGAATDDRKCHKDRDYSHSYCSCEYNLNSWQWKCSNGNWYGYCSSKSAVPYRDPQYGKTVEVAQPGSVQVDQAPMCNPGSTPMGHVFNSENNVESSYSSSVTNTFTFGEEVTFSVNVGIISASAKYSFSYSNSNTRSQSITTRETIGSSTSVSCPARTKQKFVVFAKKANFRVNWWQDIAFRGDILVLCNNQDNFWFVNSNLMPYATRTCRNENGVVVCRINGVLTGLRGTSTYITSTTPVRVTKCL